MDTHEFTVTLTVKIDAFTEDDAKEAVQDVFGPGAECGIEVTDCNITTTTIKGD